MSLKLYEIDTTISHEYNSAVMEKEFMKKEFMTLFSFFSVGVGEEKKIKKMRLDFSAAKGYKLANIEKTDYIPCSVAPLFSCRFVEKVGQLLKDDITFYPCSLTCQDQRLNWYAAKINRSIPLIDTDKSIYKMLDDDVKLLEKASYREDISEVFYIAKDEKHKARFYVSDLFKNLCDENNLHINFKQVNPPKEKKQEPTIENHEKSLFEQQNTPCIDKTNLKNEMIKLVKHLCEEKIISGNEKQYERLTLLEMEEMLLSKLQEEYPNIKPGKLWLNPHYANGFHDEELKKCAYLLDEVESYLTKNQFLNHDENVEYFNNKIVEDDFLITPENLVKTAIEGLCFCHKK